MQVLGSYTPGSAAVPGGGYSEHKPKTPPPDLPSLLLDSRIIYIGMPLVPAVTELIVSELLYMQYTDPQKPCYIYVNSTGCQRGRRGGGVRDGGDEHSRHHEVHRQRDLHRRDGRGTARRR